MDTHFQLTHRSDIQGLRAIAILLVVLGHAQVPGLAGGFIGVDVFFVLSGFLITGILMREYRTTGGIAYPAFLARRLKRLFPALIVMLVAVMLIAPVLMSGYEFSQQSASAPYATTWTSNFFFTFSDKDYFSALQARDLFLHTWSLGVEEQFYIVWPASLLVALTFSAWRVNGEAARKRMLLLLGALFVGSLVLSLYWGSAHPLWSFYLMPSRIWQFALGALLFVWVDGNVAGKEQIAARRTVVSVAGLALILGSAALLHRNMTYPGYWALLPSLGAALVIAGGSFPKPSATDVVLSRPLLVWIGDRSYSWYLWHWPVLILGFAWLERPGPVVITGLVLLSLLLAALTYRYVELPFWKGRLSPVRPVRAIAISLFAMAVTVSGFHFAGSTFGLDAARIKKIEIARKDGPGFYFHGCDSWYHNADLKPCIANASNATRTAVLIGDSIGAQWFSLLPGVYKTPGWRFIVLTKSSCPIVDEDFFYDRIGRVFKVCNKWRATAVDYLVSIKPDVIFIGSASTYGFSGKQWIGGSDRILKRLSKAAGQIVILPGTEQLYMDGPSCLEKKNKERCTRKTTPDSRVKTVAGYLQAAAMRYANVKVLDLNDLVCPDGICAAQDDAGQIVFRDSVHLTDTFVREQIPVVASRLKQLGFDPAKINTGPAG